MTRYDGTPLVLHSVGTATIVMCEIGLGRNSVISTLLHDVVRLELMDLNRIGRHYGEQCIGILKGLCNISDVDTKAAEDQVDNFRELIVSYSSDPRVILIKLADRLEVMRSLDMFPEEKRQKKSCSIFLPMCRLRRQERDMNQLRLVLWLYCWVRERELNLRDSAPNQSGRRAGMFG